MTWPFSYSIGSHLFQSCSKLFVEHMLWPWGNDCKEPYAYTQLVLSISDPVSIAFDRYSLFWAILQRLLITCNPLSLVEQAMSYWTTVSP